MGLTFVLSCCSATNAFLLQMQMEAPQKAEPNERQKKFTIRSERISEKKQFTLFQFSLKQKTQERERNTQKGHTALLKENRISFERNLLSNSAGFYKLQLTGFKLPIASCQIKPQGLFIIIIFRTLIFAKILLSKRKQQNVKVKC